MREYRKKNRKPVNRKPNNIEEISKPINIKKENKPINRKPEKLNNEITQDEKQFLIDIIIKMNKRRYINEETTKKSLDILYNKKNRS